MHTAELFFLCASRHFNIQWHYCRLSRDTIGIDRDYIDLIHSLREAGEREVVEGICSHVVAVGTGERATSWCEDGEREPEIRIGLGDVQGKGSSPGD